MKNHILLFGVTIIFFATGCNHAYYSPNSANAPLLREKNEIVLNASASSGALKAFSGVELQGATALTKNFAVMSNSMLVSASNYSAQGNREKTKISYIDFAPGVFYPLDKERKMIVELYGGYGTGSVRNEYEQSSHSTVNFNKIFVQPDIGFKSRFFDIAFAPKWSFVNWKVKSMNFPSGGGIALSELAQIQATKKFTSFEPAMIMRFGFEFVKVQIVHTFANASKNEIADLMETYTSSFGVHIDLGVWTKLKTKKSRE